MVRRGKLWGTAESSPFLIERGPELSISFPENVQAKASSISSLFPRLYGAGDFFSNMGQTAPILFPEVGNLPENIHKAGQSHAAGFGEIRPCKERFPGWSHDNG
jgi:hypothetical protein